MKAFKVIADAAAIELLGDETRRRMIYLLRARELPISQVAEELKVTPQAIYHHVKKLLKVGMIEVAREERVENFIERYYRATAEVFLFWWGSQLKNQGIARRRLREQLLSLEKIGIKVDVKNETVSRLLKAQQQLGHVGEKPHLDAKISKLKDMDITGKVDLTMIAKMISMSNKQFEDWLQLQREVRKLLRSLLRSKSSFSK